MTAAIMTLARISPSEDVEVAARLLRRDGGIIVEGLIAPDVARQIDQELAPHLDQRSPGFRDGLDDGFYGTQTKRVQGIAIKSPTFVTSILLHDFLLGLADRILLDFCGDYWMSQAETIYLGPGQVAQELHRDDLNWGRASELGIDLQISVLTALGDYDAEVGATRVVPGSNGWPLDRAAEESEVAVAELEVGSALVYLGSLLHGGGSNRTDDRWRKAIYCSYLLGWLTPEEATALSLTPETAALLPERARALLGWASLRGTTRIDGSPSALGLWQLDQSDRDRLGGLFDEV